MKIKKIYINDDIDKKIREFGITKLSKTLKVSRYHIYQLLNKKYICDEASYKKIQKIVS